MIYKQKGQSEGKGMKSQENRPASIKATKYAAGLETGGGRRNVVLSARKNMHQKSAGLGELTGEERRRESRCKENPSKRRAKMRMWRVVGKGS